MPRVTRTFRKPMADKGPFADKFFEAEAYTDDGKVWRWCSNDHVCPLDCLDEYGIPADKAAQQAARDAELVAFAEQYRQNYKGPSAEERAEARAAHGPGVELVNVLTGRRWTT